MATLANSAWFTLTDLYKLLGPDLDIQAVAQVMAKAFPAIADMPWIEANAIAYHQTTQQSALPGNTWAKINEPIVPTKGLTNQVTDVCAWMHAYCCIPQELLRLNNSDGVFQAIQNDMRIESMGQDAAYALWYSNTNQYPERFMGLATRYSDPNNATYGGDQMIDGGGSAGDQTSVFLVDWSEASVTGIYPKGTRAGFERDAIGKTVLGDQTSGLQTADVTEYNYRMGVSVVDPRYCARLYDLDVSDMQTGADISIIDKMIALEEALPDVVRGRRVFYMPKLVRTYLRQQAAKKSNVNLGWVDYMGQRVEAWNGIPIRRDDMISIAEAVI